MEKKFKSKYEFPVYVIDRGEIIQMSMMEYLERYWNDDTTTPEGVDNRTQVRVIVLGRNNELLDYFRDEDSIDIDFYEDAIIKYGTFTWTGAGGNGPFKWNMDEYDSWEEAYETILDKFYHDFQTKSSDAPSVYMDIRDAEEALKE
jgi:hypothetical protein